MEALGGTSAADAKDKDKASAALNQESAGTGPFKMTKWERNAQIQLVANPNYWRGKPPFQRIVIRHMDESGAQLLALRNGDIDAAFNLTPEQVESLKSSKDVHIVSHTSLDFVYLALSSNPEFNPALAKKAARQAVGYAIDYDGIRDALFGGAATRPASFLPIGVIGSTEELVREIGFRQDLDKSRKLLAEAGYPQGFEFEMSYGNGAVSGSSFNVLAQKLQADLARVGIKAKLVPMDMTTFRTQFVGQKSKAAITTWTPTGIENQQWASSSVERVAKRVHWTPTRRDDEAGGPGLRRIGSEKSGRAVEGISGRDGGPGQPDHAVPADLPRRRAQRDQVVPADRGRLEGRGVRREARIGAPTNRLNREGENAEWR